MEFYIDVGELQRVVKLLAISAVRSTTDSRGRIIIEAKDGKIVFLSNNNHVTIECTSNESEIKKEGEVSVVFNNLYSFIGPFHPWNGTFGSKKVKIKSTKKAVNIHVENVFEDGTISKNGLRLDLWQTYGIERPSVFGKSNIILNSNMMKVAISKVIPAIDPNEVRGQIQGMKVDFNEEYIHFVGTTGVMLSEYKVKANGVEGEGFTSRHDFMSALGRALPADDTPLFMEFDDTRIKAKFGDVYIEGRKHIGYDYPPYKPTLESFTDTVLINKKALAFALLPVQELLDTDDHNRLTIHIKDKQMKIFSKDTYFEYNEELDYDKEFIADVNGRLFKKAVDTIVGDDLMLKISDEHGPLILDSAIHKNQNALVTPIKRRS